MPEGQAAPASRAFAVMAKPVGARCNLDCGYCYYLRAEGPAPEDGQPIMTEATLERLIRRYIEAAPGPEITFVWHGGEPTLAGRDFYRRAVELQKCWLSPGQSCRNNLQTNGTLLDDAWCAFLAEAGFDVGLSIDGTQWLHDQYRRDRGGGGSYAGAAAAVRRLQAHGVQPDLLCTVTADAAKEAPAVYRSLRELDTGWMQFIPIVRKKPGGFAGEVTPDSVSGAGYGDFLCAVFDEWSQHDLGRLDVQLFAEAARIWAGGYAGLCWMAPTCGRVLIVERDGGVYACDHFVDPAHRIGDIRTAPLDELADSPVQRRFGDAKRDSLPARCRACPWLALCGGGCPKDRLVPENPGEPPLNHLCEGLRRFFAHAQPAAELILRRTRAGQPPEAIMGELRLRERARWKNVGRNDPCPCGSGRKAKHCCLPGRP